MLCLVVGIALEMKSSTASALSNILQTPLSLSLQHDYYNLTTRFFTALPSEDLLIVRTRNLPGY
jgi:hypothetical protein